MVKYENILFYPITACLYTIPTYFNREIECNHNYCSRTITWPDNGHTHLPSAGMFCQMLVWAQQYNYTLLILNSYLFSTDKSISIITLTLEPSCHVTSYCFFLELRHAYTLILHIMNRKTVYSLQPLFLPKYCVICEQIPNNGFRLSAGNVGTLQSTTMFLTRQIDLYY